MRFLRLLPLLFASSLAPLVFAQSADLSVSLTIPSTVMYAAGGARTTGHFTLTNSGPSIAQNVTVDFGPNVQASNLGLSCGEKNGHYLCTAISLVPGTVAGDVFLSWPLAPNGAVETTTVTVSSSSPADPNPANNSASSSTTVIWQADLQLTSVTAPSAAAGSLVEVLAYYTNNGPSPAKDFKLTLSIPPGATYAGSYYADPWLTCTQPPNGGQGDLVCTGANVDTVAGFYVEADVYVDSSATPGTVITFPAMLTSTTAIQPTQTKSGSLTVLPTAFLQTQISAPASALSGDTFQTTITVTNQGPATATDTWVGYSQTGGGFFGPMSGPPGWTCTSESCHTDSFAMGTATFTIPTQIPSYLRSGTLAAKAFATASNNPNSGVVRASTTIVAPPQATLTPALTAAPAVVFTGDQLTYTAEITNTSNVDAQNVYLQWSLPGTVVATTCGAINNPDCTFAAIAAGAKQTVTRTVRIDAGAGTRLTARIAVSATNVVYDAQSASATLTTTVAGTPHVDLGVVIIGASEAHAGTTTGWSCRVSNAGPDTATDWQLTFVPPPNTKVLGGRVLTGEGTCTGLPPDAVNSQVTCHGTYLAPQTYIDVVVDLAIPSETTAPMHSSATVTTANIDSNPQNDTAVADTTLYTSAQLSASMTADKTAVVAGERVTQTLTVTNNGPDAALGVLINFTTPPGSGIPALSPTFGSCNGTPPLHCSAATLAAGATLTVTIGFQAPQTAGLWDTIVDIFWDNQGTGHGFIGSGARLQVIPAPPASDLSVTVDAAPAAVNIGDVVTYNIGATNFGGSAASDVTVQFYLPPALEFLSASAGCSGSPVVICSGGTLNTSSWATFTVTARAVAAGVITTTATVSTTSPEANSGNNSATATITVNNIPQPPPARRRAARH